MVVFRLRKVSKNRLLRCFLLEIVVARGLSGATLPTRDYEILYVWKLLLLNSRGVIVFVICMFLIMYMNSSLINFIPIEDILD